MSPLEEIDKIYDLAVTFIENSPELTYEVLRQIAEEERLTVGEGREDYQLEVRSQLKLELRKLYEPSKQHVSQRYEF